MPEDMIGRQVGDRGIPEEGYQYAVPGTREGALFEENTFYNFCCYIKMEHFGI